MRGNWLDTVADIVDEAQNSTFPSPLPLTPILAIPFFLVLFLAADPPTSLPSPHLLQCISNIRHQDLVVARIDRKLLSGKGLFFGRQTYAVTVAPGVDMALIAALCICLDEKNNEGGS